MNRENFFRKYDKIVAGFGDTKPSILLHRLLRTLLKLRHRAARAAF